MEKQCMAFPSWGCHGRMIQGDHSRKAGIEFYANHRDMGFSWGKTPGRGRAACTCSRRARSRAQTGNRGINGQLRHLKHLFVSVHPGSR